MKTIAVFVRARAAGDPMGYRRQYKNRALHLLPFIDCKMRRTKVPTAVLTLLLCVGHTNPFDHSNKCGGAPCPSDMGTRESWDFEGGLTSGETRDPARLRDRNIPPRGEIGHVNVTTEMDTMRIQIRNMSNATIFDEVKKEMGEKSNSRALEICGRAKDAFDRGLSEWKEKEGQTPPISCRDSVDHLYNVALAAHTDSVIYRQKGQVRGAETKRRTAAEAYKKVSEAIRKCAKDLTHIERSYQNIRHQLKAPRSIDRVFVSDRQFQCCADATNGYVGPCPLNRATGELETSQSVSVKKAAVARKESRSWITCTQKCRAPAMRQSTNMSKISREIAAIRELDLLLGNAVGNISATEFGSTNDRADDQNLLVGDSKEQGGPDSPTLFFMGCMQGCAGRLSAARDRRLSQIGCENHLDRSSCVRVDLCRWNELKRECSGLRRRCALYCLSVVDQPRTVESAKFNRREDEALARREWIGACEFGCEIPRSPWAKPIAPVPCRRVDPCEVDPKSEDCDDTKRYLRFRAAAVGTDEDCIDA